VKRIIETELAPLLSGGGANQLFEIVGSVGGIRCDDLSIAKTVVADGARVESHFHRRSMEIYLFTSGTGTMIVDDEQFPVGAGVTVLIEPNEWHELVTHSGTRLEFFAISQPAWVSEDHLTEADPS